jgi:hypothetical protein
MKRKPQDFIPLFHSIGITEKVRVDFNSDKPETDFYELLKLEGYNIYLYIAHNYRYTMSIEELKEKGISFSTFEYERKTWFGLSSETRADILIHPNDGFFFPYQYGHFFYLYTKHSLNQTEFAKWMNIQFPNKFMDFGDTEIGLNTDSIKLLNSDDYLLVTNHGYQKEFGITGNPEIVSLLRAKLKSLQLDEYEESEYIQTM